MTVVDRTRSALHRSGLAALAWLSACAPGDGLVLPVAAAPATEGVSPAHLAGVRAPAATGEPAQATLANAFAPPPAVEVVRLRASPVALHALPGEARAELERLAGVILRVESDTDLGAAAAVDTGLVPGALVAGAGSTPLPETTGHMSLGRMLVAVVVHPKNPLRGMTRADLARVITGQLADWRELGVPLGTVELIGLPHEHPLQLACEQAVSAASRLPLQALRAADPAALAASLRARPAALALLPLTMALDCGLTILSIDGVAPDCRSGAAYPLGTPIRFVLQPGTGGAEQRLVAALRTPAGSQLRARWLALP